MLNLLLPSLPYDRTIDPMWQEELDLARQQGYHVSLYDAEQHKLHNAANTQGPCLYRGWMLNGPEYEGLAKLAPLLVPLPMYLASHQATGWYEAIAGHTPQSYFVPADERAGIQELLRRHGRCFVKGLSKSFGADSVVWSLAELEVLIKKYEIDIHNDANAFFVREFVPLSDQPEQRFFVVRGRAFGAGGATFPAVLAPVLLALQDRWFCSIDVAYTASGQPIVIEVGDGQVSDTKEWTVAELYETAVAYLRWAATAE